LKKYIVLLPFLLILFTSCSLKKVYEPKVVAGEWKNSGNLDAKIVDVTSNIAQLDNKKLFLKSKVIDLDLKNNEHLISYSNNKILTATIDGNLTIRENNNSSFSLNLKKSIATASIKDDILAVIFTDNEIALYSLKSKEPIFKSQVGEIIAVDSKIVPPYFFNDLVIFPTLDGKIVIVNIKFRKISKGFINRF